MELNLLQLELWSCCSRKKTNPTTGKPGKACSEQDRQYKMSRHLPPRHLLPRLCPRSPLQMATPPAGLAAAEIPAPSARGGTGGATASPRVPSPSHSRSQVPRPVSNDERETLTRVKRRRTIGIDCRACCQGKSTAPSQDSWPLSACWFRRPETTNHRARKRLCPWRTEHQHTANPLRDTTAATVTSSSTTTMSTIHTSTMNM